MNVEPQTDEVAVLMTQLDITKTAIDSQEDLLTTASAGLVQRQCEILLSMLNRYVGGSLQPYPDRR